jgi:hypothetical protein
MLLLYIYILDLPLSAVGVRESSGRQTLNRVNLLQ